VRPAIAGLAAVVTVVFVGTFVFPTRTFLSQRAQIADAREELSVLDHQNQVLADRADTLRDDAEIERLAREQYNLVKPGEDAFALLPPTGATTTTTTTTTTTVPAAGTTPPPPEPPPADHRNPVRRAWDAVTGLF
jgi:hypothetical protein